MTLTPFSHTLGPRDAKVVIVGECFGKDDDLVGKPFMGPSGQELTRLLRESGFSRSSCLLTNVFPFQPSGGNIESLCGPKSLAGKDYPFKQLSQGKYILPSHFPHISRLHEELNSFPRNIVLALGNTACWSLLGSAGIGSLRGVVSQGLFGEYKVLPTYNPAAVLRNWAYRPIVLADLMKAQRESSSPIISRPERYILVSPTLFEIQQWTLEHALSAEFLACDIETKNGQITEIGFASSAKHAMVIPFTSKAGVSFWPSVQEECLAWRAVERLLTLPAEKIWQNGLYDLQYIMKFPLQVRNSTQDTMLFHHALYPELQKGLGFLGSIYSNEAAWKLMRKPSEEVKKDD